MNEDRRVKLLDRLDVTHSTKHKTSTRLPVNSVLIFLVLLLAATVALFTQHYIMERRASIEAEEAYQQAIEDVGRQNQMIIETDDATITVNTIKEVIAPASKLITYEYFYTDADVYEKNSKFFSSNVAVPFTTNRIVYTYSGVIGAGVDVDQIKYEIDDDKKVIYVELPEAKILSHEISADSFKCYDVKKSIFQSVNLQEYINFTDELEKQQEDKLMKNELFWDRVVNNTEMILSNILTASGQIEDYVIKFR